MKARYVLGALAFVALVALGWYFLYPTTAATSIRNDLSSGTDIIAFGDSLVWGEGADEGKNFVSLLSQRTGQPIVNLGNPGDTTAEALARVSQLDKYNPKVVILLIGGNDYLKRVPSDETFANLGKLIENIQSRDAIVLLLGIRGGVVIDHFALRFEKLRDTYHTAYVSDVLGGIFGNHEFMSDEVHPNNAGYAKIADRIYPVLAQLLK